MLHQGLPRGIRLPCTETSRSGIEGTPHSNAVVFVNKAIFMPIILRPMEEKGGGTSGFEWLTRCSHGWAFWCLTNCSFPYLPNSGFSISFGDISGFRCLSRNFFTSLFRKHHRFPILLPLITPFRANALTSSGLISSITAISYVLRIIDIVHPYPDRCPRGYRQGFSFLIPLRDTASAIATAPSFGAGISLSVLPKLPIGVLAAPVTTTSFMSFLRQSEIIAERRRPGV